MTDKEFNKCWKYFVSAKSMAKEIALEQYETYKAELINWRFTTLWDAMHIAIQQNHYANMHDIQTAAEIINSERTRKEAEPTKHLPIKTQYISFASKPEFGQMMYELQQRVNNNETPRGLQFPRTMGNNIFSMSELLLLTYQEVVVNPALKDKEQLGKTPKDKVNPNAKLPENYSGNDPKTMEQQKRTVNHSEKSVAGK